MPPQSKVAQSIHYNEIMDKIREGWSSRKISRWLKDEYDEDIGHGAISSYRKNHIEAEALEIVDINLKKKNHENDTNEDEKVKENHIKERANAIHDGEITSHGIAEATANQLQGLLNVSEDYIDAVKKMEAEADDPDSKTSWKDVASEKRNAKKIYLDYMKTQDTNIEVNVDNHITDLSKVIKTDKIRERLDAKRKRRKSKQES